MPVITGYLAAAQQVVTQLESPLVTAAWLLPSALPAMTVGGLAGHLAYQVFTVTSALNSPAATEPPIPLLAHYERASWVGAPLDNPANAGIRGRAEEHATEGAPSLASRTRQALADQRTALVERSGGEPVFLPQTGWALTLDDFLTTRLVELVVHLDDLAASLGQEPPQSPDAAFDPVLVLLSRLAARRHGQSALLRALTRVERAPAAINVF